MSSEKPIIFISCGQFTQEEKSLGQSIRNLVDEGNVFRGYFAENQSSLQGVTGNIFAQLYKCFGLVCVMHNRGTVSWPNGAMGERGSVWIEQELAIAAFLTQVLDRDIKTRVYVKKGISREGVRDKVIINPKDFELDDEVLVDFPVILREWAQLFALEREAFSESLAPLLEELMYNQETLSMDLSNFQSVFDESFSDFRRGRKFRDLRTDIWEGLKRTYLDIANYSSHLRRIESIQNTGSRANEIYISLRPAKEKALEAVRKSIQILREEIEKTK